MVSDKTPIHVAAIHVNKINGIRAIRDITGLTLVESKRVIEAICSDESIIQVVGLTSCHIGQHTLTLDLDQVVKGCDID